MLTMFVRFQLHHLPFNHHHHHHHRRRHVFVFLSSTSHFIVVVSFLFCNFISVVLIAVKMASKPGPLYKFPWEDLGNFKYLLLLPFAIVAATGKDDSDDWCFHMCAIVALRYFLAQVFLSVSRMHALTKHTQIQDKNPSFKQIDREDHWDDFILLQVYVATAVHHLPLLNYKGFPLYNQQGLYQMLLWHVTAAEFVYYWLHRALHHHYLYSRYHSHHHACKKNITEKNEYSHHDSSHIFSLFLQHS
jgi:hypothetical protein